MTDQADHDREIIAGEVYRVTIVLLGRDCQDRDVLAGVASWLALTGGEIKRAAVGMRRSRSWVYKQRARLREILPSPDVEDVDDYLEDC